MNCTISTLRPWPTARNAVPSAAVVLPLPGPVFTMINPFLDSGNTASECVRASARIRVAAQHGKPAVNLFQEERPGPLVSQSHSGQREQEVRLLPERCREPVRSPQKKNHLACASQRMLAEPVGEFLRGPLSPPAVQQNFCTPPRLVEQLSPARFRLRSAPAARMRKVLRNQLRKMRDPFGVIGLQGA